jgi:hypothetical protein
MTIWTPEWSLTVNGSNDYASLTLADVAITSGRTDIYSQATAGYASFTILNFDDTPVTINLNDQVNIKVKDSTGTFVNIFGGYVTDLDLEVRASGTGGMVQNMKVIALGALSKLPKSLTEGVLSKAFDGDQIYTILSALLFNSWNEVPAALTWATYDPLTKIQDLERSIVQETMSSQLDQHPSRMYIHSWQLWPILASGIYTKTVKVAFAMQTAHIEMLI